MEEAARKFARRILLLHLALLVGVVAVVFFASREVYHRTYEQATQQFEARQSLLAKQTSRGIEAFYHSIFNDLDLLRQAPADDDEDGLAPSTSPAPTTAPVVGGGSFRLDWRQLLGSGGQGGPAASVVRTFFSAILWKQLEGRASHLFSVDRERLGRKPGPPPGGGRPDRPERPEPGGGMAVQILGPLRPPGAPPAAAGESGEAALHPRDLVLRNLEWFKTVEKPQISPFQLYDVKGESIGLNLVVVPTGEKNPRLLVAAVPIRIAQSRFVNKLNTDADSTSAVLVDETGVVMIGNTASLAGRNVRELRDPEIMRIATSYVGKPHRGVETLERAFSLGGQNFAPSMMAVEPVSIGGKKWTLMIMTPLSDVDMIVRRVFERAVFWAIFVVCSMTAILVSSSIQLIRSRIRTERMRTEILTKELTQAREIQLAWLPQQGVQIPSLDIAAVNHPASHISGDFYNWFELPDGRTVVTIGDVTGHGMAAAFLMATTQLLVHSTMLRIGDPGQALQEVNRQLCMQVFNGQFVTMVICVIDMEAGTIEVATAGHYPPLLGNNGRFEELAVEPQLVLGVENHTRYPTEQFELPPSASIVLYTDGVIDARSPEGKRFEMSRLMDSLNGQSDTAQTLVDSIVGHINHFRGNRELPDDLTLVCIQTQSADAYRASQAVEA